MRVSLILLSAAWIVPHVASQAATCEESGLNCHQGSTCESGDADFSDQPKDFNGLPFDFHKHVNQDGWHCECPDGMTGLRCNRKYELCGTTGHVCYHGGTCLDGLEDAVQDNALLYCDCQDAVYQGSPMVGKFCEIQGTVQCGDTDIFCTNSGTCVDGFETKAHPCQCESGHRGPHCEFDEGFVPECVLECANGGQCSLGIKSYDEALLSEFWALHDGNFMYCSCPEGWYGPTCEIEGKACGSNMTCFNGAGCLETLHSNGEIKFTCDCSVANTDEMSYSGEFCEYFATSNCSKNEDQNGKLFCVNGGTCKANEHEGCNCPDGFHGPRCEYRKNQTVEKCRLQCQNSGRCRSGTRDSKLFKQFGQELQQFNETHRLWEHCVCPEGYFGIQCEHQLEICPGGEHVCLHGSTCVAENEVGGDDQHTCNCDQATSGVEMYAGKYCQYTSTDICTKSGKPGVGRANFAFCVNDGVCKSKVSDNEEHPGCTCPEDFSGPHCEFLQPASVSPVMQQDDNAETGNGPVVGLAITMLLLVVLVAGSLLRKYLSRSQIEEDTSKVQPSTDDAWDISPEATGDETVDMQSPPYDGSHLQTKEII